MAYKYTINTRAGISKVNIRTDHSRTATDIGDVYASDKAEGNVMWEGNGEKWLNIATLNGQPKTGWVCIYNPIDGVLCNVTENSVTPPSVDPVTVDFAVEAGAEIYVTPAGGTRVKVWPQA
jgi:hypothetical protein